MKDKTRYRKKLTEQTESLLAQYPDAKLVKNRHRAARAVLRAFYPNLIGSTDNETMMQFIEDVGYVARKIRKLTEGLEQREKTILSQDFQQKELSHEPGLLNNIKHLKSL